MPTARATDLDVACSTCDGPIPTAVDVDAHDHEECEGCGDFCWFRIGGDHCSRELPEGLQVNRMQLSVTLEPPLFRRLLTLPFDDVAIAMVDGDAVLVDQVEYDGMLGSNDFCRGGGSRVFFRVGVAANGHAAIAQALVVAKRVQRRLIAFLKERT